MKATLLFLATLLVATLAAHAETAPKLAGLFSDHMVMQRDQAVPVWGWCEPGGEIAVEFAGQRNTTKADAAGKWLVKLDQTMSPSRWPSATTGPCCRRETCSIAKVCPPRLSVATYPINFTHLTLRPHETR